MSFYKIPQNYAPGFVPQRYTFINDAAAATLTARLTDTRTAESVAELVLRDLWMPEIDVSAFLRRMARRYGLLVTGGSDFHGATRPDVDLGTGLARWEDAQDCAARLCEAVEAAQKAQAVSP